MSTIPRLYESGFFKKHGLALINMITIVCPETGAVTTIIRPELEVWINNMSEYLSLPILEVECPLCKKSHEVVSYAEYGEPTDDLAGRYSRSRAN